MYFFIFITINWNLGALALRNFDKEKHEHIRVEQGQEPLFFLHLFKGKMIIKGNKINYRNNLKNIFCNFLVKITFKKYKNQHLIKIPKIFKITYNEHVPPGEKFLRDFSKFILNNF